MISAGIVIDPAIHHGIQSTISLLTQYKTVIMLNTNAAKYSGAITIHPSTINQYAAPHFRITVSTRSGRRLDIVPLVVAVSKSAGKKIDPISHTPPIKGAHASFGK